ncbi:hypothetical protein BGZ52_009585 [Haplosporangium bisporale]|nr:hypothetical protein BGZ52_009585 [Haplosporangium bisporale]KAF9215820.1 hypothetical protein BGZ59_000184 [Podila verticillata]KFH67451.1 hypothetical protein MVEG_06183 [Podila verticillata NRRL 6337]
MSVKNITSSSELDNLIRSAGKVIVQYFNPAQPDEENSVSLFELYSMDTDITFARLNPQKVQDAAQRAGFARFPAFEAYHNGAKVDQYVPHSAIGANSQNDPPLYAFIERLRDRA